MSVKISEIRKEDYPSIRGPFIVALEQFNGSWVGRYYDEVTRFSELVPELDRCAATSTCLGAPLLPIAQGEKLGGSTDLLARIADTQGGRTGKIRVLMCPWLDSEWYLSPDTSVIVREELDAWFESWKGA